MKKTERRNTEDPWHKKREFFIIQIRKCLDAEK